MSPESRLGVEAAPSKLARAASGAPGAECRDSTEVASCSCGSGANRGASSSFGMFGQLGHVIGSRRHRGGRGAQDLNPCGSRSPLTELDSSAARVQLRVGSTLSSFASNDRRSTDVLSSGAKGIHGTASWKESRRGLLIRGGVGVDIWLEDAAALSCAGLEDCMLMASESACDPNEEPDALDINSCVSSGSKAQQ